ncbi:MAG: Trk system potassium transporter TrkA [Pirellulales bacterium]|nr:Trk system potassium transporter TrkA [Pirellulales bacterium]
MNIVILGAGTVGTSTADLLCRNRHNVTVVDVNPENIRRLNERLDVRGITGSASESSVLFQADVMNADLCLALTGDDETNMVGASISKSMGARRTIARVYSSVFRDLSTFDYQRHFDIDRMLSLEHLSAMELAHGIRHPGSVTVEQFARGELEVQEIVVAAKTVAVDTTLRELKLPKGVRVASVNRDGVTTLANAEMRLQISDRITLVGQQDELEKVRDWFQRDTPPKQGVVIAGGGETGFHLARALESRRFHVVVMEANLDRCDFLSKRLRQTTVVHCDATRRNVLEEERVGSADVFVACTGDDEDNIMAGVEAREVGAKTIMAIVGRPDYGNVVGKLGIDHVVSPRAVMARQVLGFLNKGPVVSRWSMGGGGINVLEIEVDEDVPATEHVLAKLPLPQESLIVAVVNQEFVRVPGADDRLSQGDIVIAMVADSAMDGTVRVFSRNGG